MDKGYIMSVSKIRTVVRWLTTGVLTFILYGLWAFFANQKFGIHIGIKSGITQGIAGFVFSVFMAIMIEQTFEVVRDSQFRILITAFLPLTIIISFMVITHYLMDTPRIFHTISLPVLIGTIYCITYAFYLSQQATSKNERWQR